MKVKLLILILFILSFFLNGCSFNRESKALRSDQDVNSTDESTENFESLTELMQIETYYINNNDKIVSYLPNKVLENQNEKVPMVLNLHWTGGTPEEQILDNGWLPVAESEGFIIIAPYYNSYDSVYNHTDYFYDIVQDAFKRYPMIDKTRVYVTGFSNGGAAAVALTDQYPELFAAIAPEGWMVGMRNWQNKGLKFDMPFQIIQGSNEYTYTTSEGSPAIMRDEQIALSDLLLFNGMKDESLNPDYNISPYWGYPSDSTTIIQLEGKNWTVSNYFKNDFDVPFGQLILVEDGTHQARKPHGQLAWEFLKHFRRNKEGKIEQIP